MLQRLRHRAQGQEGFTLIELLVVILIIGILAGVAIPVFLSQTAKANDANIKSDINSAATAEETYFTNGQVYIAAGGSGSSAQPITPITSIQPSLTSAFNTSGSGAESLTITTQNNSAGSATGYTITAKDPNGVTFSYAKDPNSGAVTRTCTVPSGVNAGGCVNPGAASNGW